MSERLPDTWTAVEGRVFLHVARLMTEHPETLINASTVAKHLELQHVQVTDALHALVADGLIGQIDGTDLKGRVDVRVLTPKGRRRAGRWPDSGSQAQAALLSALDQLVEAATTPEERTRRQRFRDAAGGLTKDTLTAVVGAVAAAGATGML